MNSRALAILLGVILISGVSSIQSAYSLQADENGTPQAPVFYTEDASSNNIVNVNESVELVPGAGPWIKHLDANLRKSIVVLEEIVTIAGAAEVCDWHLHITPGQNSLPRITEIILRVNGGLVPPVSEATNDIRDWNFPCLSPGDRITIDAVFSITGSTSFIEIAQWPTNGGNVRMAVGGEFIGIDTVSVLVAGAQYSASWMIPVFVSAIGIGIVIARKF